MWTRWFNRLTLVLLPLTVSLSQLSAQDRPKFLVQEVNIDFTNGRDILEEVHKTASTPEFQALASAAAGVLGVPPAAVGAANLGMSFDKANPTSEERRATFAAPEGYTTCRVDQLSYEPKYQAGPSDVTWNMTIKRTCGPPAEDNTGYYVVVPKSWAGTQVKGRVRITYVLADPAAVVRLTQQGLCMAHNTCVFLCRNNDCSQGAQGPACDPNDKRPDRWLAHKWETCTQ